MTCDLLGASQLIAAFAAGATVATVRPAAADVAGSVLAVAVIVVARPLPVLAVLVRTPLSRRERFSVARWLAPGPRQDPRIS